VRVSHEGADLELDVLASGNPVKGFLMKEEIIMGKLCDSPMRWAAALRIA